MARQYRMNVGTIVESALLKVKLRHKTLGSIEEYFINNLSQGDTFLFGGEVLTFESVQDNAVRVSRAKGGQAQIPSYAGGRMPLSTHLAEVVKDMIHDPTCWTSMPDQISEWLELQREKSNLPDPELCVIETFPHEKRFYTVIYSFAGRNANDTLGFLAMRRMKRLNLRPMGFVVSDYALAIWSLKAVEKPEAIFDQGLMFEDYEEWLHDTPLMKRLFRDAAVISCMIERRHPGLQKTGKQILVSSDLYYDVLMKYQPNHVLLRAAYHDARHGLIEADRVTDFLKSIDGKIMHKDLDKISPMAVPTILQVSRETLSKTDREKFILDDMEEQILKEAGLEGKA
jgi:ATP-dependent Lhr-like helicase